MTSQAWKTNPVSDNLFNLKGEEERAKYKRDSSTEPWMIPESNPFKVPSVTEEDFKKEARVWNGEYERNVEWVNFYKSDIYTKDKTTNLMMAPVTEETCKANDAGFVCKVRPRISVLTMVLLY